MWLREKIMKIFKSKKKRTKFGKIDMYRPIVDVPFNIKLDKVSFVPTTKKQKDVYNNVSRYNLFKKALKFTLKWEGGYVNDKDDPGGATNKGITQKVYNKYRMEVNKPLKSVKEMLDIEMRTIYFKDYWLDGKCHELKNKISICHFDCCVNTGIKQSSKILQRVIKVNDDGIIGPITLNAFAKFCNNYSEEYIINKYLKRRRDFYYYLVEHKNMKKFLKGWLNRVNALEQYLIK